MCALRSYWYCQHRKIGQDYVESSLAWGLCLCTRQTASTQSLVTLMRSRALRCGLQSSALPCADCASAAKGDTRRIPDAKPLATHCAVHSRAICRVEMELSVSCDGDGACILWCQVHAPPWPAAWLVSFCSGQRGGALFGGSLKGHIWGWLSTPVCATPSPPIPSAHIRHGDVV